MPVQKINLEDCYVCESIGHMGERSIPSEVFYAGPGKGAEAKKAAKAEAARRGKDYPALTFVVQDLSAYLNEQWPTPAW